MAVSVALPARVRALFDERLQGVSRTDLAERADRISQAYRRGAPSHGVIASPADALSYALTRMPATYAAVRTALNRAAMHVPDLAPEIVLDLGAGPGTAALAVQEAWPGVREAVLVEPNAHLAEIAKAVVAEVGVSTRHVAVDAAETKVPDIADVVVASYVQVELPEARAAHLVAAALAAARKLVVLVEPGTVAGFARIRRAREVIADAGWHIAAPCPGSGGVPGACPLPVNDWCHFSVRLARSRDHRLVKGADAPFEDEPYSYVVATPERATPTPARILRQPIVTKGDVSLSLCVPDGLDTRSIARRDPAYKAARKADAGDVW
jgi:ribosomal protein RSM22 (predicted rRNA methylase)